MTRNQIILGKCEDELHSLPDNSVDAVVTDPPYGLKFMGKKWDHSVPGPEIWQEVFRVLKPGGHMLVACGTRTQHRMAVNIEDAGFEIRDVIAWHYGEGFPKSMDISKQIDKLNGREILFAHFAEHYEVKRKEKGLSHNQICEAGKFFGVHNHGGASSNWGLGLGVPTIDQWNILQPLLGLSEEFFPLIQRVEAERAKIGSRKGSEFSYRPGEGNERRLTEIIETEAATDNAKVCDGWGTALKPATEFWTLARKPISEPNVAVNVLRWGTGAINIDACRIQFRSEKDYQSATFGTGTNIIGGNYAGSNHTLDSDRKNIEANRAGRFPANVILDEFMASQLNEQSGERPAGGSITTVRTGKTKGIYGQYSGGQLVASYGDSGGASRFYKVIEWTEEDRYWERFFYVAKPSSEERRPYNNHPTVKPLALMHFLIKMICPQQPGRIVLDPFAGSGTTLIAARQLGLDFVAYEMEALHIPIIEQRLKDFLGLFA